MRDLYCVLKVDNETIARYALASFPGPGNKARCGYDLPILNLIPIPHANGME